MFFFLKSCIRETSNRSTDADSSTNIFHEDIAAKFYVIFFHEEIAGYGPLQSSTLQCPELCLIDQDSQEYFLHQEIAGYGPLQSSTLQSPELCLIYQDSEEQNLEEVPAITCHLLMKKVDMKR